MGAVINSIVLILHERSGPRSVADYVVVRRCRDNSQRQCGRRDGGGLRQQRGHFSDRRSVLGQRDLQQKRRQADTPQGPHVGHLRQHPVSAV